MERPPDGATPIGSEPCAERPAHGATPEGATPARPHGATRARSDPGRSDLRTA